MISVHDSYLELERNPAYGFRVNSSVVKNLALFLSILSCASCSRIQSAVGPRVDVPRFAIAVKLSPKAEKRLRDIHESILVIAYFDGDALPGQGRYNPPMRDVYLGRDQNLVDANNIARFDHSKVPLADWNRLADKDYFVTINTVSARKADQDNLLYCNDPISRIESFRERTIEVQCRLGDELDGHNRIVSERRKALFDGLPNQSLAASRSDMVLERH